MNKITKDHIHKNKHLLMPGFNAASEVIKANPSSLQALIVESSSIKDSVQKLIESAIEANLPVVRLGVKDFDELLGKDSKHQGVTCLVKEASYSLEEVIENLDSAQNKTLLVLDRINDNHNLGALFRLAACAGISGIVFTKDSSAKITPTVRRISMGGTELVPAIRVNNLSRAITQLKESNIWVYGAAAELSMQGLSEGKLKGALKEGVTSVFKTDFPEKVAIVLGSEGEGLRRLTMESCDALISIPHLGSLESLNVSQAASVLLYEVLRQQTKLSE